MNPIKYVIVERGEGPTDSCDQPQIVKSIDAAEVILNRWALTAPPEGRGYDKCDFTIVWYDGETYLGRYDINRGVGADIRVQVRGYLDPAAGSRMEALVGAERVAVGRAFLAAHAL